MPYFRSLNNLLVWGHPLLVGYRTIAEKPVSLVD